MTNADLDALLNDYHAAADHWTAAIRAEEALAAVDHSMVGMERWDAAGLAVQDAEQAAKTARDHYKNALRMKNYGF